MQPTDTMRRLVSLLAVTAAVAAGVVAISFAIPQNGAFNVNCGWSHTASDDPIVFPGQPGASHQHEFFGAETTDAFSNTGTLRASPNTCARPQDKAGYWVPTLFKDGERVQPSSILVYYRGGNVNGPIEPFPTGLRIIAGNANATTNQSAAVLSWNCKSSGIGGAFVNPPTQAQCSPGAPFRFGITANIHFPNCWDGTNLDSANHKSHMTNAVGTVPNRTCPASHPFATPKLQAQIHYSVFGPGVSLSSGPHYTYHADFFNAWETAEQQRLVTNCINGNVDCGSGG